jgi:hypothetical protein
LKELTLVGNVCRWKTSRRIDKPNCLYDFSNPAASISDLTKVYVMIQSLDENHWKALKIKEIKKISCLFWFVS